jgi:hypothetical protein
MTFVAKKSSTFTSTAISPEAQQWKGGPADDFTKYTCKVRKLMIELPPLPVIWSLSTFNKSIFSDTNGSYQSCTGTR